MEKADFVKGTLAGIYLAAAPLITGCDKAPVDYNKAKVVRADNHVLAKGLEKILETDFSKMIRSDKGPNEFYSNETLKRAYEDPNFEGDLENVNGVNLMINRGGYGLKYLGPEGEVELIISQSDGKTRIVVGTKDRVITYYVEGDKVKKSVVLGDAEVPETEADLNEVNPYLQLGEQLRANYSQ